MNSPTFERKNSFVNKHILKESDNLFLLAFFFNGKESYDVRREKTQNLHYSLSFEEFSKSHGQINRHSFPCPF